MERRSLFEKIFGRPKAPQNYQRLELLDGYRPVFTNYHGRLYEDSEIRACVDAIARNGAKMSPKHIRSTSRVFVNLNKNIQRLISEQPNELMSAYDFYYKVISQLELYNNSFVFVQRDPDGTPTGLYPIRADQYNLMEYQGEIYLSMRFGMGRTYTASYKDDVIHLRRFFCDDEIMGGSNKPILKTMSFKHIIKEGMINAIKTTQSIKGYIKSTKAMMKPEDVKAMTDQFVNDFLSNNSTGIGGLDATTEFTPVTINPKTAEEYQIKEVDAEILNYFGLSENILQSKYNEDEWNAFYESVIEPIGLQMGLEFTNKIFTKGERSFGNKIVFESNRLQYASNKTKISLVQAMRDYMTMNEIREIFNLAPTEDGDKILQSLNYVNSDIADEYQTGGTNEGSQN